MENNPHTNSQDRCCEKCAHLEIPAAHTICPCHAETKLQENGLEEFRARFPNDLIEPLGKGKFSLSKYREIEAWITSYGQKRYQEGKEAAVAYIHEHLTLDEVSIEKVGAVTRVLKEALKD